ncbi:PLP-dependent aminotransferase family protein [Cronobacter sakazakii]|uniref:MocR-like pyridoxine biosynthesis transcription factor PdxR n=1 Tax=Cronobacter sakazakii TaxID=28141 RepID=UPI0018F88E49|nr:PLP-dependent aminotransferase family protein [Cronobacter sakazakii]EKM1387236.1 PLP-dependent aminotransferase family protein [Cronobacter sakazakii]EKM6427676.1 PLP-dependent aminotransferase family protein [Cronobacter sakazakii]ELY7521432.1 PLP-dependent aminotransferase family protein [Cronobacter sakazakii]ELZ1659475.1 PLP-dependent aminotransferase family protein [Cronobacter sakazakii]UWT87615.1 PLP-dependent aminotransferase family protein [Cronobacter sakazakii]
MHSLVSDLLLLRLGEQRDERLHKRLYNALRLTILDGSLPAQSRLPASRDLAQQLGLSRNTVLTVYEQLLAEGYVTSRAGSGTFVAGMLPDNLLSAPPVAQGQHDRVAHAGFSSRGKTLLGQVSASPKQWGAFIPGVPDVHAFPHQLFSKIQARISRRPSPQRLTYSCQGGTPELQRALVDYLRVSRSVHCTADQVLITEGIHQAIDLVARMLCDRGDTAWVEEPSYWGIRHVLQMNEVNITPVTVDRAGMVPPESAGMPPRLIFVTPSHQYPLGAVMSLERRQRLLTLARQTGSWIVEDDYDSEFRFSGQPIPALQGLVADPPVIYIGTFSKTLYPGLRIGYVVLPRALAHEMKTAHAELYRGGHSIIQAALAEFIEAGHYSAHIRRMRLLYGRRRACLTTLITRYLGPEALSDFSDNAGLHLVLNLPDDADDVEIARLANARDILVRPLSRYYLTENRRRGLLMGFACVAEEKMEGAFKALLACIEAAYPALLRRA